MCEEKLTSSAGRGAALGGSPRGDVNIFTLRYGFYKEHLFISLQDKENMYIFFVLLIKKILVTQCRQSRRDGFS